MIGLVDCCTPCPCPDTETVNIPGIPGENGSDGNPGVAGENSFTLTTADFVLPPADDATPVTVTVSSTGFMAVGQPLFIPGALFMLVAAIIDSTHVSLISPSWESNVNAGNTISAGAKVTPSGWQPAVTPLPTVAPIAKYGSGTPHTITGATFATVTFGTSGAQQVTLTTAGTWMLYARARIDYVAATFAAVRTVSLKLRRTNNTAGDVTNSATAAKTQIITTLTFTALDAVLAPVAYVTANVNDVLAMQVSIDTDPTAGSIQLVEADIVAVYVHA